MSSTVIGFASKQGRRPRPVNEAWSKSADSTDDVLVLPMTTPERWDIFCSVADNYGDARVAWRLARQLVAEHRRAVRLFVDTLPALSRIAPDTGVLRLPLNRISRDPAVVDAYNNDPLVFRTPIRARLGAEMLVAMDRVDAGLPGLRVPLLVMQGTADGLVDPGCGPHVYERAGSADKTLKMYDGLWHEIFNEPERDHVLGDLTGWLRTHLG